LGSILRMLSSNCCNAAPPISPVPPGKPPSQIFPPSPRSRRPGRTGRAYVGGQCQSPVGLGYRPMREASQIPRTPALRSPFSSPWASVAVLFKSASTQPRGCLLTSAKASGKGKIPSNLAGHLRDRVRELEREHVTVQEAARKLGITESAVRKRAARGQIRSVKVTEGKKQRLYIFLDSDEDKFPEPFQERYMRSLEDRVRTLEDEVYRQQAIILSMSQSMQALTGASEAPEAPSEGPEGTESQPSAEGAQEGAQRRSWWRRVFGS
jgi:excisionase family DNA binding protein